jgi:DNA-binding transcriptional MerR regulator
MDESFDEPLSRSLSDRALWPTAYPATADRDLFTIGEMAREFGTTPRALRFHEDKGLLSPHRQGGARLYGCADRERLTLVIKAKHLGFTLAEIRQMLAEPAEPAQFGALSISRRQCFDQIRHLEQRKREIETALAELRRTYSSFYARLVDGGG